MAAESDPEGSTLSPDDAFAVLGNETRMKILRSLSEADGPVAFSELRDRVGIQDSGQFNYHLGELDGHFVHKTERGYKLRQPGRRVIEAVLSGAVTQTDVIEPTRLDSPCPYCGADIEVSYREEAVLVRCTACIGSFGGRETASAAFDSLPSGTLTMYQLPPAGVQNRSSAEQLNTSLANTYLELIAFTNGFCPRCTGQVEHLVNVCEDHAVDDSICDDCGGRFAVSFNTRCTNCGREKAGTIKHLLLGEPRVRSFFETRGIDTIAPDWADMEVFYTYEENVLETEPLKARFTFTVGDDKLTVTIDEDLNVSKINRSR